ncbi:hypothetical protein ACOMHN_028420 [Nucella lapillus]
MICVALECGEPDSLSVLNPACTTLLTARQLRVHHHNPSSQEVYPGLCPQLNNSSSPPQVPKRPTSGGCTLQEAVPRVGLTLSLTVHHHHLYPSTQEAYVPRVDASPEMYPGCWPSAEQLTTTTTSSPRSVHSLGR